MREMKEGGGRESIEALGYVLYLSQREKETETGRRESTEGGSRFFLFLFFCTSVTHRDRETAIIIF